MSAVGMRHHRGSNGRNVSRNKVLIVRLNEKKYTYGVESE
jgi:hypothetical protein